jgi:hypothetical protein
VDVGAVEFQPPATTTLLTASAPTVQSHDPVTVTATVTGQAPGSNTPQGTVTFRIDGVAVAQVPLVNGMATLTLPKLGVGVHTTTATYNGDVNFSASTGALPVIPNVQVPPDTPLSAPRGHLVTLRVIRPGKHARSVKVLISNTTGDFIFGRLVLVGLSPRQFKTGRVFKGSPAVDVMLLPDGTATVQLPNAKFSPLFVAGF